MIDKRRVERVILAALAVGFLLVAVAAGALANMIVVNQRNARWVEHTFEVRDAIGQLRLGLARVEAARRGYMLSPTALNTDIYREVRAGLAVQAETLRDQVGDNPVQRTRAARIAELMRQQLLNADESMRLAVRGDRAAAVAAYLQPAVEARAAELRGLFDLMEAEEARLLTQRDAERGRTATSVYILVTVAGLLLVVTGAGAAWVMIRYTRQLDRSRADLNRLNAGLEEAVRERTADLTRANDEIQRFAYIVSHDLRAPLVNIIGFTSELEAVIPTMREVVAKAEGAGLDLPPDSRVVVEEDLPEALGFIRTSSRKMDRLINAILDLSRQGRRVLTPERLDMNTLMRGLIDSLTVMAQDRGGEIAVEGDLPSWTGDRLAAEQIFSNLLENALKYGAAGRPTRVTVRGRRQPSGGVVFEVADNGRGIDPRDQERVFDLFRRAGQQDVPGEGIGLANVRALVYRLGGTISVRSTLGEGATFIVSLPPAAEAREDQAA